MKQRRVNPLHVSVLGAGALGRAYACELARAGAHVTLVLRETATALPNAITLSADRRSFPRRRELHTLTQTTRIPEAATHVLVCVRGEQIEALLPQLRSACERGVCIVILSPLMPDLGQRIADQVPNASFGMPTLIAELSSESRDTLSYWVTPSPTLFEPAKAQTERVGELMRALQRSSVPCRVQSKLLAYATATTLRLFPLQLGLLREPELSAWTQNARLLQALAAAFTASRALAARIHTGDRALHLLAWLLSFRLGLWGFCLLMPRLAPRVAKFLGHHFGEKLRSQHQVLYAGFRDISRAQGVALEYSPLLDPQVRRQAR